MTEADIIKGCQEGLAVYQKELVVRYSPMLMTVSRRYSRDDESAKDILQDSFIKIFKHIHKYREMGSFKAWLRRIVVNTALQSFDKLSFKREIPGLDDIIEPASNMPDVYAYLGAEELIGLIQLLPEGFKQVFNMYVIDGMTHREISQVLGITESTSRSQLLRARNYLKNLLKQQEKIRV